MTLCMTDLSQTSVLVISFVCLRAPHTAIGIKGVPVEHLVKHILKRIHRP